jgi:hypothetical protein
MGRLQNERESKIDDLLNWAVMAHGGLDRWNSFRTVAFEFSLGGALWDVKGQTGLLADSIFEADIHKQRATLGRFGASDRRVRFAPDRLVLESNAGKEIQVRVNPRAAFAGHVLETLGINCTPLTLAAMHCGTALCSLSSTPIPALRRRRSSPGRRMANAGGA